MTEAESREINKALAMIQQVALRTRSTTEEHEAVADHIVQIRVFFFGEFETKAAKDQPVDSIGTCSRCGYYGPGPGHDCKAEKDETTHPSTTGPGPLVLDDLNMTTLKSAVVKLGLHPPHWREFKRPEMDRWIRKYLDAVDIARVLAEGRKLKGKA